MLVLDAWALLAYLRDEPAAERIEAEWLAEDPAICAINLGEALYIRMRERGTGAAEEEVAMIGRRAQIVEADRRLVWAAARIKAGGGLSFADAFCVATAERLAAPLWTGDPEIVGLGAAHGVDVVDLRAGD